MALLSGSGAKISEVGRHTRRCIKGKAAGMLNAKSGNHTVFLDLAHKHCQLSLKPVSARHSFLKKLAGPWPPCQAGYVHLVNPWDARLIHAYPHLSQPSSAIETTAGTVTMYKVTSRWGHFQE